MPDRDVDLVVVGAGFAGLACAREAGRLGLSVRVVEARDRIGGRTWVDERWGLPLELGGTWVHWLQPHVWAELTRYGIGVTRSPVRERAVWLHQGERWEGPLDDLFGQMAAGTRRLLDGASELFPRPFEPMLRAAEVTAADTRSTGGALAALELHPTEHAVNDAIWSTHFSAPAAEGALTQALRWSALANGDPVLLWEACETYKVDGGTVVLADAMAADSPATVELGRAVVALTETEDAVEVETDSGTTRAGAVVVTAPINALAGIELRSGGPAAMGRLAREGQASRGAKLFARIRGHLEPVFCLAAPPHPIAVAQVEFHHDQDTILVAFVNDRSVLDPADREAVRAALDPLLDAELVDIAVHDWSADPLSRETWPMLRPGQLALVQSTQDDPSRVMLAGSDYARGWAGFIDGAIESGMAAARRAHATAG